MFQLDPAAGPNRAVTLGELCSFISDPNMLTADAQPRYPSFAVQGGSGDFAETKSDSVVLVRHTQDGLLSAKYHVKVLTGKCVFTDAAIALAKSDGDKAHPARGEQDFSPFAQEAFCQKQCARNMFGRVPTTTFNVEALLAQCKSHRFLH